MKSNVFLRARSLCAGFPGAQLSLVTRRSPAKFPAASSETGNPRPEPVHRQSKPFFRQWLDSWRSRNTAVPPVSWTLITTKSTPTSSRSNPGGNHEQSQ